MMENNIYRHNALGAFTIVGNDVLQDHSITFFAKGLLVYLLSLPADWNISVKIIADKFDEKECRILRAFKELIDVGYCIRKAYHHNGLLAGQSYYVTNVRGNFGEIQPPQKTVGLKNSDTEKNSVAEKTGVKQSNNSNNNKLLFNKQNNIGTSEVGTSESLIFPEEKKIDKKRTSIFRNSDVYFLKNENDYSRVEILFNTPEFAPVDIVYYFNAVADWSDTKIGIKRTYNGWIATIRNFIRSDLEKGKVHRKPDYTYQDNSSAIDYLQDNF